MREWNSERIVFGPYPTFQIFSELEEIGVKTIVSLLDERLPYEAKLLADERELAERRGIAVVNFPLASIFDNSIYSDYDQNIENAVRFVTGSKDRMYIHCYLGKHRVGRVKKKLDEMRISNALYRGGYSDPRERNIQLVEQASKAFDRSAYDSVLILLSGIQVESPAAKSLRGWSFYRLEKIDNARKEFLDLLRLRSQDPDGTVGLGYCDLRTNENEKALALFSEVLVKNPQNGSALTGKGIACLRLGRNEEAKVLFQNALKIDPHNADAKELFSVVNRRLQQSSNK